MRRRNFAEFVKGIVFIHLFIFIILIGVSVDINEKRLPEFSGINLESIFLPFSSVNIDQNRAVFLFKEAGVILAEEENEKTFTTSGFKSDMLRNLVISNIQALAYGAKRADPEPEQKKMIEEEAESSSDILRDIPVNTEANYKDIFQGFQVVLYCTHSAESYIPNSGKARLDGERGLVNNVALHVAGELKKRGLDADFVDTIHDYPDYNESYTNSRKTVRKILDSNRKVLALFDIHRDSIPGLMQAETVKIKGKRSARILIVVGTDQRKPHPEWRKNLEFAEKIYRKGEEIYPGLIKGIRTKAGTYNQEFFAHSLLLEFGSDYNTFSEAAYAGELFADILVEVLKEEMK